MRSFARGRMLYSKLAPVAQLDRVPGYEPGGRGFKSCRARQTENGKGRRDAALFIPATTPSPLLSSERARNQLAHEFAPKAAEPRGWARRRLSQHQLVPDNRGVDLSRV